MISGAVRVSDRRPGKDPGAAGAPRARPAGARGGDRGRRAADRDLGQGAFRRGPAEDAGPLSRDLFGDGEAGHAASLEWGTGGEDLLRARGWGVPGVSLRGGRGVTGGDKPFPGSSMLRGTPASSRIQRPCRGGDGRRRWVPVAESFAHQPVLLAESLELLALRPGRRRRGRHGRGRRPCGGHPRTHRTRRAPDRIRPGRPTRSRRRAGACVPSATGCGWCARPSASCAGRSAPRRSRRRRGAARPRRLLAPARRARAAASASPSRPPPRRRSTCAWTRAARDRRGDPAHADRRRSWRRWFRERRRAAGRGPAGARGRRGAPARARSRPRAICCA